MKARAIAVRKYEQSKCNVLGWFTIMVYRSCLSSVKERTNLTIF